MTTDGKVNTRDGARLHGISERAFLKAMLENGVRPEIRRIPDKYNRSAPSYWWEPPDILRVRAERKLALLEAKQQFTRMAKARQNLPEASRLLARKTRQETERRKILQRIAQRDGRDVKELYLAAGLTP
jgi:hypothetical protein